MAARPSLPSHATAITLFFAICIFGIGLGVVHNFAIKRTTPSTSAVPLYYGKKRALHVAPESLTGNTALGADFAEVYVASLAASELRETRSTQYHEFRPVAYPPLTLWIYGWFAGIPYPVVLTIHSAVSLSMFLLATGVAFSLAGTLRHFWKIALLSIGVCFCTPAGYSHYERGQFDLYTSAAILLCLAPVWIDRSRLPLSAAGGFFAALKLSSLPFLGTFSVAAITSDTPKRRLAYLAAPAVLLLSLLVFASELPRLAEAMQHMEGAAAAGKTPAGETHAIRGVSFLLLLPPYLAKSLQILCTLVFIAALRWTGSSAEDRPKRFAAAAFPFALAMVVQGMAYGAGSWEYRIVALLGMAAAFILWVEKTPGLRRAKLAMGAGFAIFLLLAARTFHFIFYAKPSWQASGMSACYLLFSLACFGLAIWLAIKKPQTTESKQDPSAPQLPARP
jgi:hypothetical protein